MAITTVLGLLERSTDQGRRRPRERAGAAHHRPEDADDRTREDSSRRNALLADRSTRPRRFAPIWPRPRHRPTSMCSTPKLATAIRDTRTAQSGLVAAEAGIDAAQTALDLEPPAWRRRRRAPPRPPRPSRPPTRRTRPAPRCAPTSRNRRSRPSSTMRKRRSSPRCGPTPLARIAADVPTRAARLRRRARQGAVCGGRQRRGESAAEALKLRAAAIADAQNRRRVFEAADAAFRDYVVNAKNRFDQALAVAARIADPTQNPLTDAEKASIHHKKPDGSTDAALQTERNDAAAARKAVATAQLDVDARQTDLDIARLKVKAANIDLADPDTDPAVVAAKAALDAGEGHARHRDRRVDCRHENRPRRVGDRRARDHVAPARRLRRRQAILLVGLTTDPSPLANDMDTAETDLVASLVVAGQSRAHAGVSRARSDHGVLAGALRRGQPPRRELGALRGDS